MTELLKELIDKWMIVCAIIAVGFTGTLMRKTSEKVTKWKYAILSTIVTSYSWLRYFQVSYSSYTISE